MLFGYYRYAARMYNNISNLTAAASVALSRCQNQYNINFVKTARDRIKLNSTDVFFVQHTRNKNKNGRTIYIISALKTTRVQFICFAVILLRIILYYTAPAAVFR